MLRCSGAWIAETAPVPVCTLTKNIDCPNDLSGDGQIDGHQHCMSRWLSMDDQTNEHHYSQNILSPATLLNEVIVYRYCSLNAPRSSAVQVPKNFLLQHLARPPVQMESGATIPVHLTNKACCKLGTQAAHHPQLLEVLQIWLHSITSLRKQSVLHNTSE